MNRDQKRIILQAVLFVITLITTTLAGAEWCYGHTAFRYDYGWADLVSGQSLLAPTYSWAKFFSGLWFSIPFLLILTVHEFGHFFTAMYHKVRASLPYYIPLPPLPLSIGTMGAVIRLKSKIYSKKQNFDIGIAGPLAGFVMALIVLFYGFTHLPEPEYIFEIHPEFKKYGLDYAEKAYNTQAENSVDIIIGKNLLFLFFEKVIADPARVPNPRELYHYPLLFAGFLSLVFTGLNLLPVGQLDGGHVTYGLFGFRIHRMIATVVFIAFLLYSGLGVVSPSDAPEDLLVWVPGAIIFIFLALTGLGLKPPDTLMYAVVIFAVLFVAAWIFPGVKGYPGWLVFVFILGRFIGIQHPPSEIEEPLDPKRIVLGWLSLLIFILCFSPAPIVLQINLAN